LGTLILIHWEIDQAMRALRKRGKPDKMTVRGMVAQRRRY
jgi:hypothetical protein